MRKIFIFTVILMLAAGGFAQSEVVTKPQKFYIAKNPSPSEYITMFVTDSITKWQQKGMFEPTAEYQKRVTTQTRQQLVDRLTKIAADKFLVDYKKSKLPTLNASLRDYDADNQTFLMNTSEYGQMIVPVPLSAAPAFQQSWQLDKNKTEFYIDGDNVKLKKMAFTSQGQTYWYDNSQQAYFASVDVNINFAPIDIDIPSGGNNTSRQTIGGGTITVGESDVDVNIPTTNVVNDNTFVVIIANEKYQKEVPVSFAVNDGRTFNKYCNKTLGIPDKHIHYVENATLNNIKFEIKWLKDVLTVNNGNAKAIVYYSGHGIPDEANGNAYILPVDGYGSDPTTGYSLDDLYNQLGNTNAVSVTYFIDACFSGAKKEGGVVVASKCVTVKAKTGILQGNSVVFSAATEDETAYIYKEKSHGMFTYFLLKKLQETAGNVNYKELADYVQSEVRKTSLVENSKKQTPTVTPSFSVNEIWGKWNFNL